MENARFKYRTIFDMIDEIIFILDESCSIMDYNTAASKLFEVEREDLVNKSFNEIVYKEDWYLFHKYLINDEDEIEQDTKFCKIDGTIFSAKTKIAKVKSGEKRHTILFITEKSQVEEPIYKPAEVITNYNNLFNKNNSPDLGGKSIANSVNDIGALAAGIAHEIGNPLTSISSITQVIQRSTDDVFVAEKLGLIKVQINRIADILKQLIKYTRPVTKGIKSVNINTLIKEVVEYFALNISTKEIKFIKDFDTRIDKTEIDSSQVTQLFSNIISNAIEAIGEKVGEINISTKLNSNYVQIEFKDNGRGIPPEKRGRIFEPFFSTKPLGKGLGLGLWVSYGIIKNLNGEIYVKSEKDKGSTFSLLLPYKN